MTIDQINFSKLKTFDGKTSASFEQMIYQLVKVEYGHLGELTAIDGSGGDGGVEFYLILKTGEKWGWQCKYYEDNGRLNESSRFRKIEDSLATACVNHPDLSKWVLCLKTDLTVDIETVSGKKKSSERSWFKNTLPKSIPSGLSVNIEFVGVSEICSLLSTTKHIGIRSFFFGELEVNREWFEKNARVTLGKNSTKYDPNLHTMGRYEQSQVDLNLLNPRYLDLLDQFREELNILKDQANEEINNLKNSRTYRAEEKAIKTLCLKLLGQFDDFAAEAFGELDVISHLFQACTVQELNVFISNGVKNNYLPFLKALDNYIAREDAEQSRLIRQSCSSVKKFFREFERLIRNYTHPIQKELHFLGNAAVGKTHLSCDITHHRLANGLPVIFLTADSFTNATTLEPVIRELLDIPVTYTFEMLLSAMETYASILKTKIPIIIDGLNETTNNRHFSSIWRTHLPALSEKLNRYEHLTLVTTCRGSYRQEVWPDVNMQKFFILDGFEDTDVTLEAVVKYFNKYHLKTDWHFFNPYKFEKPIYLKLYCEIKNPDWQNGKVVEVNISSDSNHDLFSQYFKQINERVTLNLSSIRNGQPFILESLHKIARYFWENKVREIPIDDYYQVVDGDAAYVKGESKAEVLIHEGLVISRDFREEREFIYITYEIMAGYLIARYLLTSQDLSYFLPDGPFHQQVKQSAERHPLYENIIEELALLFPVYKSTKLHRLYPQEEETVEIYLKGLEALWAMPGDYIQPEDLVTVSACFTDERSRKTIIYLSKNTLSDIKHPLNATFLSDLLYGLSVTERDLSWTEFIRFEAYDYERYLSNFEKECRMYAANGEETNYKFHLVASYVQWMLTSTNRKLRDLATRALFHYSRRFPAHFISMAFLSLGCNDPYFPERMLAVLYGLILTDHKNPDFAATHLKNVAERLFGEMFSVDAAYFTTHVLIRDYASHCIQVALIHYPDLLSVKDRPRIYDPYALGKKRKFRVHADGKKTMGGPIQMDFGNYTIGQIVKDGHSYDNPPEKKKVRGQIYQRIYDLGWNTDQYKELDDRLARQGDYYNRSERPKVERYGKKYSWIAFHEITGHRDDCGLLANDWNDYRSTDVDIDPSFPEYVDSPKIINTDYLGDRTLELTDWLNNDPGPDFSPYLVLQRDEDEWVCMDGWMTQLDRNSNRAMFAGIRGLFTKGSDYAAILKHLSTQDLTGRWLPEIRQNYYTFSAEMYLFADAVVSNEVTISFETGRKMSTFLKGEEGYYPEFDIQINENGVSFIETFPDAIEKEVVIEEDFSVLLPVMEYSWESHQTKVHHAGHTIILSAEIASQLKLTKESQSFGLVDADGRKAVINVDFYAEDNTPHRLTYLRKDLLEKYIMETDMKLIWGIWGERELKISTDESDFPDIPEIHDDYKFQRLCTYDELSKI